MTIPVNLRRAAQIQTRLDVVGCCGARIQRIEKKRFQTSLKVVGHLAPCSFYPGAMRFVGKPFFPCFPARPGFFPWLRLDQPFANQVCKSSQGIGSILVLAAGSLRLDVDNTIGRNPVVSELQETGFHCCRQRCRSVNVESQVNCSGNLVDILTAWSLRPNRLEFDFGRWYFETVINYEH